MGLCLSHQHFHTQKCCPTRGKWCKKLNSGNMTALAYAIYQQFPESDCLTQLSKTGNIHGVDMYKCTLLHYAVSNHYTQLPQILIDRGIDINTQMYSGDTTLHCAVMYDIKQVKLLIDNGANINIANSSRITPLAGAVYCNEREACILLLEEGAKMNVRSSYISPDWNSSTHSILVAYGFPFKKIKPDSLPQYLADVADAAFSRRKVAIRWWFWVHRHE
jgi:ankyrin repeat protein